MTIDVKWELLDKYFSGICSPEELEQIARWIAGGPGRGRELASIRRIWDGSVPEGAAPAQPRRFVPEHAWEIVHGRIAVAHGAAEPAARSAPVLRLYPEYAERRAAAASPRRRAWYRSWPLLAAAAGVLLAVGGLRWMLVGARHSGTTAASADAPAHEYATARGQRTEILLRDGTRVTLSVESRLRVPESYGDRARDVYLDGEAYFDVAHDSKRPFRVHTAGAVAEDIGTAFLVRAYADDSAATVVVAEGKVELRSDGATGSRGVALMPRQLGRLDASRLVSVESDVNVEQYLAWRRAQLAFRNAPLARVTRDIERWYDVDITLGDSSLASIPITGVFATRSVDAILGDISRLLDLRYSRQGRRVLLAQSGGKR